MFLPTLHSLPDLKRLMDRAGAITLNNLLAGLQRLNDGVRLHRETPLTLEEAELMDQELRVQKVNISALERRYRLLRASGSGLISLETMELICSFRDLLVDLELQLHISRLLHATSLPGILRRSTDYLLNFRRAPERI